MHVAAVVVNYHTGPVLGDCLRRLLRCAELAELVLVDNGSAPGEIDALLAEIDDRRVIRLDLPSNPGFAVACNRGARASHSPWLLFLNPDCGFATFAGIGKVDPDIAVEKFRSLARGAEIATKRLWG